MAEGLSFKLPNIVFNHLKSEFLEKLWHTQHPWQPLPYSLFQLDSLEGLHGAHRNQ